MSNMSRMVDGAMTYLKGKLQWTAGKATGDNRTKAKGMGNQAKGGAKYESGKVGRKLKKSLDK